MLLVIGILRLPNIIKSLIASLQNKGLILTEGNKRLRKGEMRPETSGRPSLASLCRLCLRHHLASLGPKPSLTPPSPFPTTPPAPPLFSQENSRLPHHASPFLGVCPIPFSSELSEPINLKLVLLRLQRLNS